MKRAAKMIRTMMNGISFPDTKYPFRIILWYHIAGDVRPATTNRSELMPVSTASKRFEGKIFKMIRLIPDRFMGNKASAHVYHSKKAG